jgi:DNA-directed RNA polymerase beta subunit
MSRLPVANAIVRKTFGKIKDIVKVPDLIEIQSKSFNDFAQLDELPSERSMIGLQKVLRDIFPIDYSDKMSLEFVSYELGIWNVHAVSFQVLTIVILGTVPLVNTQTAHVLMII